MHHSSAVELVALIATLAMTVLGGCRSAPHDADRARLATTPTEHEGDEPRTRHARFNEISRQGRARLVFVGDSITQGWEGEGRATWERAFAPLGAANFGTSGDRTEHVLWRLDHGNLDGLSPALIVLMVGTNNARHREEDPADTAAGVRAILDRLEAKCPEATILLLGIFPRGETADDPLRRRTARINAIIRNFANGDRVIYRDIGGVFLDDHGTLHQDIMPDFVHLSARGYELWARAIEADVARALGR